MGAGGPHATVLLSLLARGLDGLKISKSITTQGGGMENFAGRLPAFFEAVGGWLAAGFRCVIVTEQAQRMREILREHKIPAAPTERLEVGGEAGVYVLDGALASGFKLPEANLMVATDQDIMGHRVHQKSQKRGLQRRPEDHVLSGAA